MKEHAWSVVVYCHAYKLARYLFKTREEARVFKCKSCFQNLKIGKITSWKSTNTKGQHENIMDSRARGGW